MEPNNKLDRESMLEFIESLDGAAVLDAEGTYIYVSHSWERYTGHTAEQSLGRKVWELVPDTHAREVYQTGKSVIAKVVRAQGVPAVTNYIPRLDANGKVIGVFLYVIITGQDDMQDVSKRLMRLSNEAEFYKEELSRIRGARYSLDNIIGRSEAIQHLKEQIYQASRSTSTVLIEGETGSGKELIAHSIHSTSARRSANFVRVNCSAIPAELMESEFFGYAAGAFTGASKKGRVGRFELADKGSIFLDEINLLSPTMQPKFLRVLQEREIDPVGGDKSIPIDVRVIAASNIPLETLVERGEFRSDLYFRLNVIRIQAPPLRERKEDIPLLVDDFIRRLNYQLGMMIESVAPSAMDLLMEYDWPGNVRELQNAVERAMNLADGSILRRKDFQQLEGRLQGRRHRAMAEPEDYRLKPARQAFEREFIRDALACVGGNRVKAAELLGISRTVLYEKMDQYKLK
ncbi:sigma-54 interaction domain-containing protein [Lawsonibacter celer]|uniref:sigma-54 interaction domain-containing protein n=1 Tax=Lawsonibacter celer TaxID=2986526 RepID=UPI001FAE5BC0|nr:sigma 54-interacting transcriptional regulator [Lawsonibacter celer]